MAFYYRSPRKLRPCPSTYLHYTETAGLRCKHAEEWKTCSFRVGVWPGGCEDRGKEVLGSDRRVSGTLSLDEQGQEERRGQSDGEMAEGSVDGPPSTHG